MRSFALIFIGFIVGYSINESTVRAQDVSGAGSSGSIQVHIEPSARPALDKLTIRDCVEFVAQYDVRHLNVPQTTPWYGLIDFDEHTAFFVAQMTDRMKRETALHEMQHARLHATADDRVDDEEYIRSASLAQYRELYGKQ